MERLSEIDFREALAARKAGERLSFVEKEIWDMDLSGTDLSNIDFTHSSFQKTALNKVNL